MIPHPAVAAVSAAILGYEVLLVRLFAIVQWHHFAFMAISIALLGFGISGALLCVVRPWVMARAAAAFRVAAAIFAVAAPGAFLAAQSLPFNALAVVWAPGQFLWLGAIYLLLAVPFAAGGTCIGLAFMREGAAPGRVYLWNMTGSAAGALGIVGLLVYWPPMTCLAAVGALGFAAVVLVAPDRRAWRGAAAVAGAVSLAAVAWIVAPTGWAALKISEFKGLSQALAAQGARLAAERSGPLALLSVVESPAAPFRDAPGLGLLSPALPPPQLGFFADGTFAGAIDIWDGNPDSLAYLRHSTDALAYALAERPTVLVLGAGTGRAVRQAIVHRAGRIDAVEVNVDMLRLVREDFAAAGGQVYSRPEVVLHDGDPRHFLAAASGRWDLITFPMIAGGTGVRGLAEDFLLTAEALGLAYRRLAPGGAVTVTAPVDLPPRAAPKLVATMRAALEAEGVARPADHLMLIRGMGTVTMLAKRGPVTEADIARLRAFAAGNGFDAVHYPGMLRGEANRHNRLAAPAFFDAAAALLGPKSADFVSGYKFGIVPATDDRPYFHDFFRWAALPEILALGPAGGAALLELAKLIVVATLLQATVLGLVLVLLPLRLSRYRRKPSGAARRFGAYFGSLGVGFMLVEIAWIQKFTLFLGHPLYAVSVVLAGFLFFAGLGAGACARFGGAVSRLGIPPIAAAVAMILAFAAGYVAALPPLFEALGPAAAPVRVAVSLALIAPLAFFMGMPFPLGLALVAEADPDFVPWAWGFNGCASVIGAAGATLLMMQAGTAAATVVALGLYLFAALVMRGDRRAA